MALELIDHDTCFLHIPKTGGRWVQEALKNAGVKTRTVSAPTWCHMRYVPRDGLHKQFQNYFTFVRLPANWYASWYRHYQWIKEEKRENERGSPINFLQWHPMRCIYDLSDLEFNEFLDGVTKRFPGGYLTKVYELYAPQGAHRLYVGKTENLACDLVEALNRFKIPFHEGQLRGQEPGGVGKGPICDWDRSLFHAMLHNERHIVKRWYREWESNS